MSEVRVDVRVENDIIIARQAGRNVAQKIGFGTADQTRLATAISELTRNVVQYAQQGICVIRDDSDAQMLRIRVEVEDNGPGIPDVDRAMKDGYSTGRSLGMGLPGTRRIVQDFAIKSRPGNTKVAIAIARPRAAVQPPAGARPVARPAPAVRPWNTGR